MARQAVSLFQSPVKQRSSPGLRPITLRDFSGGWDATDDDDILNAKYANVLQNMLIGTDGSLNGRFGTFRFADIGSVVTGNILDMTYFAGFLVVVMTTGQIAKVDGSGVVTAIWNTAIAAALPGAPGPWNATVAVTFVPFKRDLIIHNGVNKPVTIDQTLKVTYLADLAAPGGPSSTHVPVGQYGCAVANYHVVAGIPAEPTAVYVSATAVAGLFSGATAPNDGIVFDVGAYTSISASEIRGLAGFKNWLMIFFRESTLIVTLGQYKTVGTAEVHTPEFNDILAKVGLLSQRMVVYVENDVIFTAPTGVYSAKRNLFANLVESKPLSEIIAPGFNKLARAMSVTQEKNSTFSLYGPFTKTIYSFLNGPGVAYTFSEELKVRGWSTTTGWSWSCGCVSSQGRVFFGGVKMIWQMGNNVYSQEEVYSDKLWDFTKKFVTTALSGSAGDKVYDPVLRRMWLSLLPYSIPAGPNMLTYVQQNLPMWTEDFGTPVSLDWELPWIDFKEPESLKHIRTIKMGTKGTALYNVSAYVDGLYKDEKGVVIHEPALKMQMMGNSQQGFGGSPIQTYGGGRKSNDPRLYKFPVKFKRVKIRITGDVYSRLRVLWLTFLLSRGSHHRA